MITLSEEQINNLLSSNENKKCLDCDTEAVEWVSFPTAIFLCTKCCRLHKAFTKKETLKSLNMSEFTEKEISKMTIGGNERYLSFLKEYNIPKDQNIENKYLTVMTDYYNTLIESEVNKLKNVVNSEQVYNNLISQKPSIEIGQQLIQDNMSYYNIENVNEAKQEDISMGGFFGYLGNQLYNAAEKFGINKAYNDAKNNLDSKLDEYGLKQKINQGVEYAKKAGEYIVDKGKEIAETPLVKDVVGKVSEGVNNVKESASNYISNIGANSNNSNGNVNNGNNANQQFATVGENESDVYQQLKNDQL